MSIPTTSTLGCTSNSPSNTRGVDSETGRRPWASYVNANRQATIHSHLQEGLKRLSSMEKGFSGEPAPTSGRTGLFSARSVLEEAESCFQADSTRNIAEEVQKRGIPDHAWTASDHQHLYVHRDDWEKQRDSSIFKPGHLDPTIEILREVLGPLDPVSERTAEDKDVQSIYTPLDGLDSVWDIMHLNDKNHKKWEKMQAQTFTDNGEAKTGPGKDSLNHAGEDVKDCSQNSNKEVASIDTDAASSGI